MKRIFLKVVGIFCNLGLIRQKYIIFESYPELNGSPWMIYLKLKEMGFHHKYKLIWAVDKSFHYNIEPSFFCFGKLSIANRLKRFNILLHAKAIIDSNRPVKKLNPKTIRMFTRHGGTFKKCTTYMQSLGKIDYMLTLSEDLQKIDFEDCKNKCIESIHHIIPLGLPANDQLFEPIDLWENGFFYYLLTKKKKIKKVVGWLPTFRQHNSKKIESSSVIYPFGLPLLHSEQELFQLNHILETEDVLLAVQMHHAQEKNFSKFCFSNIIIISSEVKYKFNVSTANLMNSFDALITDYSAAYHEFILLNKPIALGIDDFEEYSSKTGFCFDYFEWIKGEYLKNADDLYQFVRNIASGIDLKKAEREDSIKKIHKYQDNHSTQRVVDFLIKKTNL